MNKYLADKIAQFVWNQLGLSADETMGHDHFDVVRFSDKIVEIARRDQFKMGGINNPLM